MRPREELDEILRDILAEHVNISNVSSSNISEVNIYYQPPESVKLKYPCIIYERDAIDSIYANNKPYSHFKRYIITVITKDPDSILPEKIAGLPMSSFDRNYIADNLYHDVFTLYF